VVWVPTLHSVPPVTTAEPGNPGGMDTQIKDAGTRGRERACDQRTGSIAGEPVGSPRGPVQWGPAVDHGDIQRSRQPTGSRFQPDVVNVAEMDQPCIISSLSLADG
jgi:hypothetical protein